MAKIVCAQFTNILVVEVLHQTVMQFKLLFVDKLYSNHI